MSSISPCKEEGTPMKTIKPTPALHPTWFGDPEPDIWCGQSGINALIWADPLPYDEPALDVPADTPTPLPDVMRHE
jgi:hypothetical protein